MASTFRGKWRIFAPPTKGYVCYKTGTDLLCLTPDHSGKETIITFFLHAASEFCLLMSNRMYVEAGPTTYSINQLRERAGNFALPGQDLNNLPASFTSKIHSLIDDSYMFDQGQFMVAVKGEKAGHTFTITQITPSLEQIQTAKKGDGLDLAAVDLSGGELNEVSLIAADFSHSNLTNVKLTKCTLKKALLNDCTAVHTDFSGSDLTGANLNNMDLTGAVVGNPLPQFYPKPLTPPTADDPRPTFFGSKLNHSFLGNDWSRLDLTGATIEKLPSPLSSENNKLQVKHSILSGLNKNDLSGLQMPHAEFDNSVLDGVDLDGCDLTNASFIQASMHSTNLSNATLKNADLTGAQLGSLGQLFTLPAGFETHLNAGADVDAAIRDQFTHHGITLSATATLQVQDQNRVWQLNDVGNKIIYTIRRETKTDGSVALTVYKPAVAASLAHAYMPDAVLTGANLFGITANNIQFYGSKAAVDGSAILEEAKLNDSNLSTVNFTQAHLRGANLSNCHLFNAKFNKAMLTPSAAGSVTDLSNANLQGADFTDAQLFGANLVNAAVAVKVPTKANPNQGGVYLFSLPYKDDKTTIDEYTKELNDEAASVFSLNPDGDADDLKKYVTALNARDVATLKPMLNKHKIFPTSDAQIQVVDKDKVWQMVDKRSYTFWVNPDEKGNTQLYAGLNLTLMTAGFNQRSIILRHQANVRVDTADQLWVLDNDSENPDNVSTGYMRYIAKKNGTVLDVYGTTLRILRLGDKGRQEYYTQGCQATVLSEANMDADTICPNGAKLSVNQSKSGKTWDNLWMHASTPPKPPDCVPTDYQFCPPPKVKKKQ